MFDDGTNIVNPETWMGALLWAGVAIGVILAINLVIRRGARRAIQHTHGEHQEAATQRIRFVSQLTQLLVAVVVVVSYAASIPALQPLGTALLASASVLTIVVGLAAQSTLGNVMAGISIIMFRPFQVGDRIEVLGPVQSETGVVEMVNLGNTVIVTFDDRRIVIPNGQLVNQTIVNLSSVNAQVMAQIQIAIAYGSDLVAARSVIETAVGKNPDAQELSSIPVTELGDHAVTITAYVWCSDSLSAKRVEHSLYETVLAEFPGVGVTIPFPSVNVVGQASNQEK